MTRPEAKIQKTRMNLDVKPQVKITIEKLRDKLEADSMGEIIRRSVQTFDKLLTMQESGAVIIVRHPDGTEQHLLFI